MSGGVGLGALAAQGCAVSTSVHAASPGTATPATQVASFGWEVCNLCGNGANAYLPIQNNMLLQSVSVDVSASILKPTAEGFAEILCLAGVSRQSSPGFNNVAPAYVNFPASPNFGNVALDNPNSLSIIADGNLLQDRFLSVILKTWVPSTGAASATARHVVVSPLLCLNVGDYLVFHMDHFGIALDAEMQVVISYSLE